MIPALALAAAIVLTSPWVGAAREWMRGLLPGQFSFVVNLAMTVGALGMVAAVVWRIGRAPHAMARYGALVAAVALALGWTALNQHMSAETNAVERFHFFEEEPRALQQAACDGDRLGAARGAGEVDAVDPHRRSTTVTRAS